MPESTCAYRTFNTDKKRYEKTHILHNVVYRIHATRILPALRDEEMVIAGMHRLCADPQHPAEEESASATFR